VSPRPAMFKDILAIATTTLLAAAAPVYESRHLFLNESRSGEFFEYKASTMRDCVDALPKDTGFDVWGSDGKWLSYATCGDLKQYCHNRTHGAQIQSACPVACYLCMPVGAQGYDGEGGPCFDAARTGIRFRDGPKATCQDLVKYCNHTTIGSHVREACKLSCGLCEIMIEGPYTDQYGNCLDLETSMQPHFTVRGKLAACSEMKNYCQGHPDSFLIRHKCPLTCQVCYKNKGAPAAHGTVTTAPDMFKTFGGCDRRRRWGFCAERRRRNAGANAGGIDSDWNAPGKPRMSKVSAGSATLPTHSAGGSNAVPTHSAGGSNAVPQQSEGGSNAVPTHSAGGGNAVPQQSVGASNAVPIHSMGGSNAVPRQSAATAHGGDAASGNPPQYPSSGMPAHTSTSAPSGTTLSKAMPSHIR